MGSQCSFFSAPSTFTGLQEEKEGLMLQCPLLRTKLFSPPVMVTFVVGFAFLLGVFVFLGRLGLFSPLEPRSVYQWLPWIYAAVFLARIVGDFHFVGLFKKVKNTTFSSLDNILFMPICAILCFCSCVVGMIPMV